MPVTHYLLICELYGEERSMLRRKVGVQRMKVERRVLTDVKMIPYMLKFIESMQRFKS